MELPAITGVKQVLHRPGPTGLCYEDPRSQSETPTARRGRLGHPSQLHGPPLLVQIDDLTSGLE
jgi:hypothetical protein